MKSRFTEINKKLQNEIDLTTATRIELQNEIIRLEALGLKLADLLNNKIDDFEALKRNQVAEANRGVES